MTLNIIDTMTPAYPEQEVNHLTETGAVMLALSIHAYWSARGHKLELWARKIEHVQRSSTGGKRIYQVRSNMVGGQPQNNGELV